MRHPELISLARSGRWKDLEQGWLAAIEDAAGDVEPDDYLPAIEAAVKANQSGLGETMAWAWLTSVKDRAPAGEALELARALLLRVPTGEDLRSEVLTLYRATHVGEPELERWIERSGLASGKSVRRALRFLDVGLQLKPGVFLLHRSEDEAAEIIDLDAAGGTATLRTARRTLEAALEQVIENYDLADPADFRVLSQLRPDGIGELLAADSVALLIGLARAHGGRIDRDEVKVRLVPRHLPAEQWSGWWNKARDAVKKSKHLRIEGRSPVFLVYEPGGFSLADETWAAFEKADGPKGWLEAVESYLRECRTRKATPEHRLLARIQDALAARAARAERASPQEAFAAALVMERLQGEGLPPHPEAHGLALSMLRTARRPEAMVSRLPDARLWSLGVAALKQALPDRWCEAFGALMREAPLAQLDGLAAALEEAGRGELVPPLVNETLADPGEHVDLCMWVWRGPALRTPLTLPPRTELFSRLIALVGPARDRGKGAAAGAAVNALRATVRNGFASHEYRAFREMLAGLDESMAAVIRRQLERAEGLGSVVQEEMIDYLRGQFPRMYARPRAQPWEEQGVLYVTSAGLRSREAELDELVRVKMRENAKAIGAAAEHGDLSENSEYKFALEERDLLRARVAQINFEMSQARVLEPEDVPTEHVGIGHRVTLADAANGGAVEVTILGPWESDLARHVYSYQTPLAGRLLGRKTGEEVRLTIDDQERTFRIERFESAVAHGSAGRGASG